MPLLAATADASEHIMASHFLPMASSDSDVASRSSLRAALLESLYCDMLVLADEVRAGPAPDDVATDPRLRVRVACESLRLSARLMRMTQLLLDHRSGRVVPSRLADVLSGPLDEAPLPTDLATQLDSASRLEHRLGDLLRPASAAPPAIVDWQKQLSQRFGRVRGAD